jgi:hypothetical protein
MQCAAAAAVTYSNIHSNIWKYLWLIMADMGNKEVRDMSVATRSGTCINQ